MKQRCGPEAGDILISCSGTIGRVAVVPSGFECVLVRSAALAKINHELADSVFLQFWLQGSKAQGQIASSVNQGAQPNLFLNHIERLLCPQPPLPEQRATAAALSDVDALLGGLERLIAKKRDLKQAVMQQLLTGQTRLPGFSCEWETKRLGEAGKCLRGVSYRGDRDLSTHDTAHTKRLLRSNNVQGAVVVTDEVQFVNAERVSASQLLRQDDILICMANGSKALVGKAGRFAVSDGYEYTFGAFMGCFRTNSVEANAIFVFFLFQTGRYRDYINNLLAGSSINNLRPSSIESLEFSMPKLPEQTAIAAVLSDMDAELSALIARRDKTHALKQAMMQELLTGKTRLVSLEVAHA
jgi:type I restriction enzyme, S subunit